MARGHGRILTSIWEDPDFIALTPEQQRLYLFLISQPNLNHAGLLPLTLRRWSRKATGLDTTKLHNDLAVLHAARFIVVDDDTEELLIRSFVRNDGVWKQPKVMGAMVSGALEISSPTLRQALLAEVDRIPLDELSDEVGRRPMSIRAEVEVHITTLRTAFSGRPLPPGHAPAEGVAEGDAEPPSNAPAEGGSEEDADGDREGSTRTRARLPLPLSPAPVPNPVEDVIAPVVELRPAQDTADRLERPDIEEACQLLADLIEENGSKRPPITAKWRDAARLMLDRDHRTPEQLLNAIRWAQGDEFWRANILSMPTLRKQYDRLRLAAERQRTQRATPAGHGTDERVAGWLALKSGTEDYS